MLIPTVPFRLAGVKTSAYALAPARQPFALVRGPKPESRVRLQYMSRAGGTLLPVSPRAACLRRTAVHDVEFEDMNEPSRDRHLT